MGPSLPREAPHGDCRGLHCPRHERTGGMSLPSGDAGAHRPGGGGGSGAEKSKNLCPKLSTTLGGGGQTQTPRVSAVTNRAKATPRHPPRRGHHRRTHTTQT